MVYYNPFLATITVIGQSPEMATFESLSREQIQPDGAEGQRGPIQVIYSGA